MSETRNERLAALYEQSARIHLEIAQEFRRNDANDVRTPPGPMRPMDLGSLQQAVFDVLLGSDEGGHSPREIARRLERGDEPNIRQTLYRMQDKGVAELLPGPGPQRWTLPAMYREA